MRIVFFPLLAADHADIDRARLLDALGCTSSRSLLLSAHEKCLYSEMQDVHKPYGDLNGYLQDVLFCIPRRPLNGPSDVTSEDISAFGNCTDLLLRCKNDWVVFSNGCYITRVNRRLLATLVNQGDADVLFLNVSPRLMGYRERPVQGETQALVGYRRYYEDGIKLRPLPKGWPHHLFMRSECLRQGLFEGGLPSGVERLKAVIQERGLKVAAYDIAGHVCDLMQESGLLETLAQELGQSEFPLQASTSSDRVANDSRLLGPVLLEKDVEIESEAVVVGPTVLAKGASIGRAAVVNRCFLAEGVRIPENAYVAKRFITDHAGSNNDAQGGQVIEKTCDPLDAGFRPDKERYHTWSRCSYASLTKRLLDVIFALLVLIMFLPVLPILALLIKLDSKGPVFYRACRQGRFGVPFGCLKFRSMRTGADALQDELREINELDGPQFKMVDDPRISRVGRFLRETYLDEIPQFVNVLLGQMSVVGPRPSPEYENTLCPWWRDARLSVRPGVTGMWQVKRTRESGKDFQEWIQYDVEYVENLSFRMDLWIVYKTMTSMIGKFAEQF